MPHWAGRRSHAAPRCTSPASSPPAAAAATSSKPETVEQRITQLKTVLKITPDQESKWNSVAQAMRENAAATDTLFTQRAGAVTTMNAPDNMHSYAQIARAYADNTERLATAFDSLYASLSETQKQAADTLFRQQATAAAQPKTRR